MALPVIEGTYKSDKLLKAPDSEARSIYGYSGHDSIVGSSKGDALFGGSSEWFEGGLKPGYQGAYMGHIGDNDTIKAGGGDDQIFVGTGVDSIVGGSGYDTLNFFYDAHADFYKDVEAPNSGNPPLRRFEMHTGWLVGVVVDLQAGTYSGSFLDDEDFSVIGTASGTFSGIEAVIGGVGRDEMRGSSGNDFFKPIRGSDSVDGRGGTDILSYEDAGTLGIVLNFGTGKVVDTFGDNDTFTNIEIAIGSRQSDDMTGTTGTQIFVGSDGEDSIDGLGGQDMIDYSRELGTGGISVLMSKFEAKDTFGKIDEIRNIENIKGTGLRDVITGNGANNSFWGLAGNDNMGGGAGKDTIYGGDGKDTLGGGDDDDQLEGNGGNDSLLGGKGIDTLSGGDNDDTLNGGAGDDDIAGDAGNDTITDQEVHADFFTGGSAGNIINGGSGKDNIKGTGVVRGGDDNDTIEGAGRLYGDGGDDTIKVGPIANFGPTSMQGGAGKDTLIDTFDHSTGWYGIADYSYTSKGILALLSDDRVTVTSTDSDTLTGIVALMGSAFDDTIDGGASDDSIFLGGRGHDSIRSHSGKDSIDGGAGNDTVDAGSGKDTIDGGTGYDSIEAGDGDDSLTGGDGKDTLDGGDDDDLLNGGADKDVLRGGSGDDTLRGEGGDDTISTGGGNNTVDAGAGQDKILIQGNNSVVRGGADSDILTNAASGVARMSGGTGTDTFQFLHTAVSGGRSAVITDFDKVTEHIDLRAFDDDIGTPITFAQLKATAEDLSGGEVKIHVTTFFIIIDNMTKAELRADDFML